MSENQYCKKIVAKKIDGNTFQFVEIYDLSHPQCPIVVIDWSVEILEDENHDHQ